MTSIELTPQAKQLLAGICAQHDMIEKAVLARAIEWLAKQDLEVQTAVIRLGNAATARLIWEKMQRCSGS